MVTADRGWATETPPDTPLYRLVHSARLRVRPMNRADPRAGHWVLDCPQCAATDSIWIDPTWEGFEAVCGCWKGRGDVFAFLHLLRGGR